MIRLFSVGDSVDGDVFIATDMTVTELQNALTQARLSCGDHWTEEAALAALVDDYKDRVRVVRAYLEAGFGDEELISEVPGEGELDEGNNRFKAGLTGAVYFLQSAGIDGCAPQALLEKQVDLAQESERMVSEIDKAIKDKRATPKELKIIEPVVLEKVEKHPVTLEKVEKARKELDIKPENALSKALRGVRDLLTRPI